ncbi:uncharacterized protein [Dermacentor andersoni]|uniref:uncharacterized protein isoform X2 n=1 Tax=Dermacentor andersoni TaxID=34620 RepID=UPI0024164FCF|nr:uncharacterized protein LOC126543112 isoform X2 [Dermacentor andersoni]
MAGSMFTHVDTRGIPRRQCTSIGCDCRSFTRPLSLNICHVQVAFEPYGWYGWCRGCGHSPVTHSRVAETSTCSEQPWQVDVSRLSGSQENLEQDSTPEADPKPQSCTEQQGMACVGELDNLHLKLKPDSIPEENSELEQSSQSERSREQVTSPQQEARSATPEEKRHDKEEAPTCSHIVERSLKQLNEEKDHPERQRDCSDAEDISDAHLLIKRLLLDTRTDQCDSIQDRKQIRHHAWLLFDGPPRVQEAFSNWDMHRLQPSRVTLPKLPAETLKEWEALEKAVQDDGVATALREALLSLKGSTLRKVATTVMKKIMGHSVQQRYSMYGKRGKKAFIKTRICSVVTGTWDLGRTVDLQLLPSRSLHTLHAIDVVLSNVIIIRLKHVLQMKQMKSIYGAMVECIT